MMKSIASSQSGIISDIKTPISNTVVIVSGCDAAYFPLLKGLYLSFLQNGSLPNQFALGFLDLGCTADQLLWLREHQIRVRRPEPDIMGELADERFKQRRAQLCRPFLPEIFPEATTLAWVDSDVWVQDLQGTLSIFREAAANANRLFISPEIHVGYLYPGFSYEKRRVDAAHQYAPLYGASKAQHLAGFTMFNSGVFALAAEHPLWSKWKDEIRRIYLMLFDTLSPSDLHFGEQLAINALISELRDVIPIDPMYNYVSLWNPPMLDDNGIVRIPFPPHLPLGIIHLAGWSHFGQKYMSANLLYKKGSYLSKLELATLHGMAAP